MENSNLSELNVPTKSSSEHSWAVDSDMEYVLNVVGIYTGGDSM